jgi:hypothetical protein
MDFYILDKLLSVLTAAAVPALIGLLKGYLDRLKDKQTNEKIEKIEKKAEQDPEKISYAWDVARTRLERYFDRNLDQVKAIFWVSIFVMIVGFAFVLYGILRSINDPAGLKASYVAAISGVVTEFIGMTFMLVFRSTLQQASSYMSVLERINSVGMAVQILDSIGEGHDDLKNSTRAEIVKILLAGEERRRERPSPKPSKMRPPKTTNDSRARSGASAAD